MEIVIKEVQTVCPTSLDGVLSWTWTFCNFWSKIF